MLYADSSKLIHTFAYAFGVCDGATTTAELLANAEYLTSRFVSILQSHRRMPPSAIRSSSPPDLQIWYRQSSKVFGGRFCH